MLEQIDRQSAIGKRDYAMVLLTVRLGVRVGDLRRLELGWFDWRAKTLALTQHKTGVPLTLPLPGDVGWAVIDYIRHGRPEAACRQVFVKHRYPFTAFGSSASAGCRLNYYARRAGIVFAAGRSHGLHSLRGALAVAMLQDDTPPPVVTAVLGHAVAHHDRGALPQARHRAPASLRARCRRCPSRAGRGAVVTALTLRELVDMLVAARRAGGFRYDGPGTGAGAVRRALPPGRVRGRVDHPGSGRGVPLRPPSQGVHDPPRGDHPARSGRARPPVRLAGVGTANADARQGPPPARRPTCSATRKSAACSTRSTPSRSRRGPTGRWSTRCCSGSSTPPGCASQKR